MSPNMNPLHSRATEVWKRFVGMFGADAVDRKFGDTPPPEWAAMLCSLREHELDRGMRRLMYGGKPHVPSLPEFLKLCRTIGGDENLDPPQTLALPPPDKFAGDEWDIAANEHLLAYVLRNGRDRQYFDAPATRTLVGYKNAWAADMREAMLLDPETGEMKPPALETQKAAWEDCMQRAGADIARRHAA